MYAKHKHTRLTVNTERQFIHDAILQKFYFPSHATFCEITGNSL